MKDQTALSAASYQVTKRKRRLRYTAVFAVLAVLFCLITILNINMGTQKIPMNRIFRILSGKGGSADEVAIIRTIRMPRILMAAILGGALSVSGFLLQTYFANPIAGPFVLGISSGAKFVVALVMIASYNRAGGLSSFALIAAAFAGSIIVTGAVLVVSRAVRQMAALLVAGVMVGYICSAATDFLITFASDSEIVNLHSWSKGSFNGMTWNNVAVASVFVLVAMIFTFLLSKPIGAYQMGEAYAQSMGVNVQLFRVALILLSSMLSAVVTAFAGPISFVGIAVPFLMKSALGTSKPIVVIPASFFGGAVFCMLSDLIARMAFAPTELSISTVTSIFGAPVVLYMLIRRQKGRMK